MDSGLKLRVLGAALQARGLGFRDFWSKGLCKG